MKIRNIDPSPRGYVTDVVLLKRSRRGPACAPPVQTIDDVRYWLLHEAIHIDDFLPFFEEFLWRCNAAGLPIDRSTLHVGTLHPRMIGFAWNWAVSDEICDEIAAMPEALLADAFTKNPLYKVMVEGQTVQADLTRSDGIAASPLMRELADEGYTEYTAFPLTAGGDRQNAITFASKRLGGFPADKVTDARQLLEILALHVEKHIVRRIARNVVDTYLGPLAGQRVLDGEIRRGDGEAIDAIIFISDLRGFTRLADRMSGPDVTGVLNAYFDRVSVAIADHGGEILKFIGDGILAVFQAGEGGASPAAAALAAASEALAALEALNAAPDDGLPAKERWAPLKMGIGLHKGDVFFGNVGGRDRLDFTVIGRAVNEASRVEALCKEIGRPLLLTDPVFEQLDQATRDRLELMGHHELRGVEHKVAIYSPRVGGPE